MTDSRDRPTANLRHPIRVNLPSPGRTIRLRDGRLGYIAGRSERNAGKMTFVEIRDVGAPGRVEEMWPAEFAEYEVM